MTVLAGLANNLWQLSSWPEWWIFQRRINDLRTVQCALLKSTLQRLAGTDYGRRFALDPQWSYQEFSEKIPVASYQELQPYLCYEGGLLSETAKVWEPTGGSTGGTKWIPWTVSLQTQFRRAVAVWIYQMFRTDPSLKYGRSYWQLTPKAEIQAPEWLREKPTGFQTDGDYLGPLGRWVERCAVVKPDLGKDFWNATVEALRYASDLTLISCWSPSFLLLMREQFGEWKPRKWWPRLKLISCWTQGPSASLFSRVEELFPGVKIQGKGLLSTEAVTTIPFGSRYPLAYRSHFFEFESIDGRICPSWELTEGRQYHLLQTTAGGLIRYRSQDRVRVDGFLGQVPCLEFLGREQTSDHFGEKLTEAFVQPILGRLGRFAVLGYENGGYVLFLEPGEGVEQCLEQVNQRLLESFTYRDCLDLGQLRELRLFVLVGNGWEQLGAHLDQKYGRLKPGAFLPPGVWSDRLQGQFMS